MKKPLVTIVVLTFNSAKYVLDTLDSIFLQSYRNIELIITDDCSNDETTKICEEYINQKGDRFVSSKIIKFHVNTGITANANRGIAESTGIFLKLIAGDDALDDEFIETMVLTSEKLPNHIYVGQSIIFHDKLPLVSGNYHNLAYLPFYDYPPKGQFVELVKHNFISAPAVFFSRDLFEKMNGFDERFRMIEDYPFWVKASYSGIRLINVKEALVFYRNHLTNTDGNLTWGYFSSLIKFNFYMIIKYTKFNWLSWTLLNKIFKLTKTYIKMNWIRSYARKI